MPHTFVVENPATEEPIAEVPDHGPEAGRQAVDRAHTAFPGWSSTSTRHRSEVLFKAFELVLKDKQGLAELISEENGKSSADATSEVIYAAEFLRWFSEEAVRSEGDFSPAPAGGARTLVHHKPVGVAALVTPWNFPAAMATRKIAPALAAGCTAVLKPAAETPLTALAIAELMSQAGVPDGVLEVVTTSDPQGVVGEWLSDPRIRKLSFTGSTGVGRHLLRQAADHVLNASMELGGNAPLIVTADADLSAAVAGTMIAKFRNGGQACTAANRLYIHESISQEFTQRLGAAVERLSVGPWTDGNQIGPLISRTAVGRVTRAVEQSVVEGARVSRRANTPDGPGHFYPPTVLVDVSREATILKEEIFGPVAPIVTWESTEELIATVNATEFGLAAYVFAGNLKTAITIGEKIEAGMVGINRGLVSDPSAPFGGVKQSGLGREGAREGMREFQETQYLSVDW